jgi:hypothetical protein
MKLARWNQEKYLSMHFLSERFLLFVSISQYLVVVDLKKAHKIGVRDDVCRIEDEQNYIRFYYFKEMERFFDIRVETVQPTVALNTEFVAKIDIKKRILNLCVENKIEISERKGIQTDNYLVEINLDGIYKDIEEL